MPKARHTVARASAIALAAIAILAITMLPAPASVSASPDCPSSWPAEPQPGAVSEGFHIDSNGDRWYVIRGTDSGGTTTARAYPADDRYSAGYGPASPDETCYVVLRRAGATADNPEPEQITFPREQEQEQDEREEPAPTPVQPITLRQILDAMTPAERSSAVLCLLSIAGNTDPDVFVDDPDNVQLAIDAGCIPPR